MESSLPSSRKKTPTAILPLQLRDVCEETPLEEDSPQIAGLRCYIVKSEKQVDESIFFRTPIILKADTNIKLLLNWATISRTTFYLQNIEIHGFIQIIGGATLIATDCKFIQVDGHKNCSVNICARSNGVFTRCSFSNSQQTAVVAQDYSKATFIDCLFEKNGNASITVIKSEISLQNSTFLGSKQYAVYIYDLSKAYVKDCLFKDLEGLGFLCMKDSKVTLEHTLFNNCAKGGIRMANMSSAVIKDSVFKNVNNFVVGVHYQSAMELYGTQFFDCNGCCVTIEHSTATIGKCAFYGCVMPALNIFGADSNPLVEQSFISIKNGNAILSRDLSSPTFYRVHVEGGPESFCGLNTSDFARPIVYECTFRGLGRAGIMGFNGAKPYVARSLFEGCRAGLDILIYARGVFEDNIFMETPMFGPNRGVHHRGSAIIRNNLEDPEDLPLRFIESFFEKSKIEKQEVITKATPKSLLVRLLYAHPGMCVLCHKELASVFSIPCAHRVYCRECAAGLKANGIPQCPRCLCKVNNLVEAFDLHQPDAFIDPPVVEETVCQGVTDREGIYEEFKELTYRQEGEDDEECNMGPDCDICCEQNPDVIVFPCGHSGFCYQCGNRSLNGNSKCLTCNNPIRSIKHIFPCGDPVE